MSDTAAGAYRALALPLTCHAVNRCTPAEARARIVQRIVEVGARIAACRAFLGPDLRLIVAPEYFLTGFPLQESAAEWIAKACLEPEGREYEALGALAERERLYLAGNAYELDSHFPGLFFQTSFVIDPAGRVVLRYRRLNSMFAATPHDVWERYLEHYGIDAVFPVARTELGNLAAIASEEILYPELARCAVLRGAEILLHSTSEIHAPQRTAKEIARRARASENMTYLISANSAGITGSDLPEAAADGGSQIVDFRGELLATAGPGENLSACAEIDLEALRRSRRRPGMANLLSRQRLEVIRAGYDKAMVYPPNTLCDGVPSRQHHQRVQCDTIERLLALGVLS
jgi:predicted amidohydrolase